MKNIKTLMINAAEVEDAYEKTVQLPNTLENLNLSRMYINDLNFLSHLNFLKTLELREIEIKNATLSCIAKNCLKLHTLLLSCKNLFSFLLYYDSHTKVISNDN